MKNLISLMVFGSLMIFVVTPSAALTTNQIWDYQNELKHEEAAKILTKQFNALVTKYTAGDAKARRTLLPSLLDTFYKLGWCQQYGRLYADNIRAYQKLMSLKIPPSQWGKKMLWTVRSGFGLGATFAAKGDYKMALHWIDWAEKLYKLAPYHTEDGKVINPFAAYYNNGYDFHGLREFLKKKVKLGKKRPAYTMTVLSLVYPNVDYTAVFWGVKKGRVKRSYTWTKRDYDNLKVAQAMMKLAVEAMSNGNLSLKFITKKVTTRVYHNPKKKMGIFATPAVYKHRTRIMRATPHDLLVEYILSNDSGATGHGGGNGIRLYNLPDSTAMWTTLVHEFFHCVETHFGYVAHIYRKKNGVPGWKGVPWDQMSYYSWRFRTSILKEVNKDTAKLKYSGWISRFNWGPRSLRISTIKPASALLPPVPKLP